MLTATLTATLIATIITTYTNETGVEIMRNDQITTETESLVNNIVGCLDEKGFFGLSQSIEDFISEEYEFRKKVIISTEIEQRDREWIEKVWAEYNSSIRSIARDTLKSCK